MITKKKSNQINSPKNNAEIILKGRSVSRGIAIGKIVNLYGEKRQFYRINLKKSQIEKELRRFNASIRLAKRYLKKQIAQSNQTQADILETHLLILTDSSFLKKIETEISVQKVNAEWAVKNVAENYLSVYKTITDEHLRERYIDLADVTERIFVALSGGKKSAKSLKDNAIIFAKEIQPSTLIELSQINVKAIITEHGGWTSHTFILAREMNIPSVTRLNGIGRKLKNDETVIVDGYNGKLILRPTAETLEKYKVAQANFEQIHETTIENFDEPLKTLDGKNVDIYANLEDSTVYKEAKKFGAKGIGLYRSEFLFNQHLTLPTEKQQIDAYKKIGSIVGEDGVKIRTFDLSIEQIEDEKEKNPALGLRAIRLTLKRKNLFQSQIRALLQTSGKHKIDITLPMISDVSEIIWAKNIILREKKLLEKKGIEINLPKIGAMIEVPSAVLMIEEIVKEVDYLCLGTNDLVQYLLAVDRDNEAVEDWFRSLHPAVLRCLKKVLDTANKANIPTLICGEMAGSPVYSAVLIGLGANNLSMNVHSIPRVRNIISQIAFEEAQKTANELLLCKSADEVEKKVRERFLENWKHIFSNENLP
jgi:phosphoenolpyruvate-protein phosphotransferase (PTS system enzyme I)